MDSYSLLAQKMWRDARIVRWREYFLTFLAAVDLLIRNQTVEHNEASDVLAATATPEN